VAAQEPPPVLNSSQLTLRGAPFLSRTLRQGWEAKSQSGNASGRSPADRRVHVAAQAPPPVLNPSQLTLRGAPFLSGTLRQGWEAKSQSGNASGRSPADRRVHVAAQAPPPVLNPSQLTLRGAPFLSGTLRQGWEAKSQSGNASGRSPADRRVHVAAQAPPPVLNPSQLTLRGAPFLSRTLRQGWEAKVSIRKCFRSVPC